MFYVYLCVAIVTGVPTFSNVTAYVCTCVYSVNTDVCMLYVLFVCVSSAAATGVPAFSDVFVSTYISAYSEYSLSESEA